MMSIKRVLEFWKPSFFVILITMDFSYYVAALPGNNGGSRSSFPKKSHQHSESIVVVTGHKVGTTMAKSIITKCVFVLCNEIFISNNNFFFYYFIYKLDMHVELVCHFTNWMT